MMKEEQRCTVGRKKEAKQNHVGNKNGWGLLRHNHIIIIIVATTARQQKCGDHKQQSVNKEHCHTVYGESETRNFINRRIIYMINHRQRPRTPANFQPRFSSEAPPHMEHE